MQKQMTDKRLLLGKNKSYDCYFCNKKIRVDKAFSVYTSEDGGPDPLIIRVPVCEKCKIKWEMSGDY